MSKSKDYYELLGVAKTATKEEIKKAYKKLAMQYHPDRAPEDKKKEYEEKFKDISEAASVLGDDKKRQHYDQFGNASFNGGGAGAGYSGFDYSDIMSQFRSGMFGDFEDIFDHLFSGSNGRRSTHGQRGDDLLTEVEITLEEAASGATKTFTLNKLERCEECNGRGARSFEHCHHCKGTGSLKRTQRTPFGLFQQTSPCPECRGTGEISTDSCKACHGEGVIRRKKEIEVTIPPGAEEGTRLRIRNEGGAGAQNGPPGDLYVHVHLRPHKYFVRKMNDLLLTVPISFTQAVLGDEIEVPTLEGKATLKIPPGTQSETVFKMTDKGLPSLHDHERGDQLVKVKIQVPQKLTKKQKELILQLNEEKASKSFLERIFG
ncbi:molecular chaperone DnaJ [Candidatus Woesearchaeota archaeon]|nr:molecular chaperone DnaJ [Candidatus Woesearchaeota archaeon]